MPRIAAGLESKRQLASLRVITGATKKGRTSPARWRLPGLAQETTARDAKRSKSATDQKAESTRFWD